MDVIHVPVWAGFDEEWGWVGYVGADWGSGGLVWRDKRKRKRKEIIIISPSGSAHYIKGRRVCVCVCV